MSKEEVIRRLKNIFPALKSRFNVSKIALFGSFARGTQTEESDIDLVVEFEKPIGLKFIELADYLEDILGRKVDVLTQDGIKTIRIKKVAESIERSLVYL